MKKQSRRNQRLAEYWRGMSPAQRDWQRLIALEIPEGESHEPETERGAACKRMIEEWFHDGSNAKS